MKPSQSASVFALAVMIGIIAYALTDDAWLFAAGFFGCFLAIFISFAFVNPASKPKRRSEPRSKANAGITGAISHGGSRSVLEPVTHKDR